MNNDPGINADDSRAHTNETSLPLLSVVDPFIVFDTFRFTPRARRWQGQAVIVNDLIILR